jgi:hypothetical protein
MQNAAAVAASIHIKSSLDFLAFEFRSRSLLTGHSGTTAKTNGKGA